MEYWAHSENQQKQRHSLFGHLLETARYAASFACSGEFEPLFYVTGLLHDMGKYQPDFQRYIETGGKRGSVPHASWGAGYARGKALLEASISVNGHHKGLSDNATWKGGTEPFKRGDVPGFNDVVKRFLADTGVDETIFAKNVVPKFPVPLQREAFVRYLFSALTDSDWLSTEKHFDKAAFEARTAPPLQPDVLIDKLETEFSEKSQEGEINRMRNEARFQVLEKAEMPCGFYSLALPTGMGKTLTSIAWALKHARRHELNRIIVVLPYVNIIDQTAQILKGIFGEGRVLEHHSGYNEDERDAKDRENSYLLLDQRKKLACENWDYPIIVTTTVQFFESLFSNRPFRSRKIHNIAQSVVIFDEVQTLPKEVITPTLQILKDINAVMRTSFLFCTATQPAFEKRQGFDGIDAIRPLIEDPAFLYMNARRVRYRLLNGLVPVTYDGLAQSVAAKNAASLVIFNTKKATLEFFKRVRSRPEWDKVYHLSTAMCPSHRKKVIADIRGELIAGRKILVASTQLIEAGVDFDFPVVFRAMAPLEALIQAGGRCNREGLLGESGGKVFLFKLVDQSMPDKTYAACAAHAEEFVRTDIDQLHDHQAFARYYSQVVHLYVDPDKYGINAARGRFNFGVTNDSYRIIDDRAQPLFVYNFDDESRRLLHSVEHKEHLSREDFRKMQTYTVQVYPNFVAENPRECRLVRGFYAWYGAYDEETGVSVEPLSADKSIV